MCWGQVSVQEQVFAGVNGEHYATLLLKALTQTHIRACLASVTDVPQAAASRVTLHIDIQQSCVFM